MNSYWPGILPEPSARTLDDMRCVLANPDLFGSMPLYFSKVEEMRDTIWSDSYRDHVDGWIDEKNERISDIQSTIDRIKGWIEEMEAKLW